MSISTIYSAAIRGIDGLIVTVEATSVSSPNPKLNIIGLPDTAIRESEGRVRSAARACNLPLKKGAQLIWKMRSLNRLPQCTATFIQNSGFQGKADL